MNNSQLEALIIDHEFGELPDEVSSLLEAYLATHTEAQMEAGKIRDAMDVTGKTVKHHPEMFRAPGNSGSAVLKRLALALTYLNSRHTAFALAVVFSAVAGFLVKGSFQSKSAASAPIAVESKHLGGKPNTNKSLWASYRIDDGGNPVLLLASNSLQAK